MFISKLNQPVKRKLTINTDRILEHYLEHEIDEDIAPI